jgi:ribonucleoside-diphosphate reductase alpha chain
VSITVTVRPDEWVEVAAWVYRNWQWVAGVSFLPAIDHTYQQAPYTECTREEYLALVKASPNDVRFADLVFYETTDGTSGGRELACSSDTGCEVVDIP